MLDANKQIAHTPKSPNLEMRFMSLYAFGNPPDTSPKTKMITKRRLCIAHASFHINAVVRTITLVKVISSSPSRTCILHSFPSLGFMTCFSSSAASTTAPRHLAIERVQ